MDKQEECCDDSRESQAESGTKQREKDRHPIKSHPRKGFVSHIALYTLEIKM